MTTVLPHNAALRRECRRYLTDLVSAIAGHCEELSGQGAYLHLYKVALALDAVLSKLSASERPKLSAARTIARRVPLLVAAAQLGGARIELRRLIEICFLVVYFSDHKIEWREFQRAPGAPISRDTTFPIALNAHREPSFYSNYAKELFAAEPSGLAVASASALSVQYGNLSAFVHTGTGAAQSGLRAWSAIDEADVEAFGKLFRAVAADCSLIVAARFVTRFNVLPPVHRAWFDWLLGARSKIVRSGPFGLNLIA